MIQLWENENEEKKIKLLQAALEEFAARGYELASTNVIVQRAGVSKGLLFHQFQNKKKLYLYVATQCMETFFGYLIANKQHMSADPLDRLRDINLLKVKLFTEEPLIYQLSVNFFVERSAELKVEIDTLEREFNTRFLQFYLENLDVSQLRQHDLFEKSLQLIIENVEGMTRRSVERAINSNDKGLKVVERLYSDLEAFLQLLKYGLYK